MQTNLDGLNKFFSALGGAFAGPDAMDIARASVLGSQRGLYDAQTRSEGYRGDRLSTQNTSRQGLSDVMTGNPEWASDPAMRARAAGLAVTGYDDPRVGPPALTGAATFTNPNAFNPSELSNVLMGTGVVNSYGQTPDGYKLGLANELERQRIASTTGGAGKPPQVGFTALDDISGAVEPRLLSALLAANPNAGLTAEAIDPSVSAMVSDRVSQLFQTNGGNAQTAIAQAIQEMMTGDALKVTPQGSDSGLVPNWGIFGGDPEAANVTLKPPVPSVTQPDAKGVTGAVEANPAQPGGMGTLAALFAALGGGPRGVGIGNPDVQQAQAVAAVPAVDPSTPDGRYFSKSLGREIEVRGGRVVGE
jgi:hypothetical protein